MQEDTVNQLCRFSGLVCWEWIPQLCSGGQEKVQRTASGYRAILSASLNFLIKWKYIVPGSIPSSSLNFYQVGMYNGLVWSNTRTR